VADPSLSAYESLPQIPEAKVIARATVSAFGARETLFVLVAMEDGRVDLHSRLPPADLAEALRALAADIEARGHE
jgi:hypothetical protein